MLRKTLGVFIDKLRYQSPAAFFAYGWDSLGRAPDVLEPKRIGNWEPLKKVQDVSVADFLKQNFYVSNPRCSVFFAQPTFSTHRYFMVKVHLKLAGKDHALADEAYEWLHSEFPFEIIYMGTRSPDMLRTNLQFHQLMNSGLFEVSLEEALAKHRHLLDRFERAA